MNDVQKQLQTQLKNIEERTGKTLKQLQKVIKDSGLEKHGQLVAMLKKDLGMGHGDANTLVHVTKNPDVLKADTGDDVSAKVDEYYSGKKADLRPIHDAFMKKLEKLGDFEIAPKKTYLSLRRKKQFAMIGPATNSRVDIGLNMKGAEVTGRLESEKPGGMCTHKVRLTDAKEVDKELMDWVKKAFDAAG